MSDVDDFYIPIVWQEHCVLLTGICHCHWRHSDESDPRGKGVSDWIL